MRDSSGGKHKANSYIENNVSVNSKRYHSQATLGYLTKNHVWGGGEGRFAHINCSKLLEFDRCWEVAKTQHMLLIPTQNCFFSIHIEYGI